MQDDDENFEMIIGHDGKPARVLRDGRSTRVSMRMRDAARPLRRRTIHDASVVTDGTGNGGLALRRPGYRMQLGDAIAFDAKAEALRDYEKRVTTAYLRDDDNGVGSGAVAGQQVGDMCTVRGSDFPLDFGGPGHLQMRAGRLVCVPDTPRRNALGPDEVLERAESDGRTVQDAKARALADYDRTTANAWRQGK